MSKPPPGFVPVTAPVIEELQILVGPEQVITSALELESLSKDCYWYSPVLMSRLEARLASAAVKVSSVDELRSVLALAYKNDLPVTVRGGATGNYGQCIPLCGGLVVDTTGLDRVIRVEGDVVATESGVRVIDLERAVRVRGMELRCLPSTWVKATIGGFIAGGTGGIGSISWGVLRDQGTLKRVKLLTLEAEPKEVVLDEAEALKAFHAYGTNGVIIELELRLAPARRWDQVVLTGKDWATTTAFATRVAYDDAIPKRLVSLLEPSFGAAFKPMRKWLPEGQSIIWLEVDQSCTEAVTAEAARKGLTVTHVIPHHDPKRQPMIMEYSWNHSTLWMLKGHPGHTYLQLTAGPNFTEQGELLKKRFPGQIHLHYEFIRGRDGSGVFGQVVPVLLPVVKYLNDENLREIMAYAMDIGLASNNPHTCYLGEQGVDAGLKEQAALKRLTDPKGLLNPGKLRGAKAKPSLAKAFPDFLYS